MLTLGLVQANGVLAYFTTLALFALGWQFKVFSPARVYDLFGEVLAALNIFSLAFCLFLYFKVGLRLQKACYFLRLHVVLYVKGLPPIPCIAWHTLPLHRRSCETAALVLSPRKRIRAPPQDMLH